MDVTHKQRQPNSFESADAGHVQDSSKSPQNLWNQFANSMHTSSPSRKTPRRTIHVAIHLPERAKQRLKFFKVFFTKAKRVLSQLIRKLPFMKKYPVLARIGWGLLAVVMLFSTFFDFYSAWHHEVNYDLSVQARALMGRSVPTYGDKLVLSSSGSAYDYNKDYIASSSEETIGQAGGPRFVASFATKPSEGTTITDPVTKTSITYKPKFAMDQPRKDQNHLIYPVSSHNVVKVYTLKAIGVKEDIILESNQGDEASYAYTLQLSSGTEARLESNGSIGVYGVSNTLLGNVSTSSEADATLLEKARQNGEKNTLLFTFPAPYIKETNKKVSNAKAWFTLDKDTLTIHASGLGKANYPLSIDPSIYVETAAKLMAGNNESNIDFDIGNDLIQKSQTTGARIDAWSSTNNLSSPVWAQGTAAAGGYIYSVGGAPGGVLTTFTDYTAGSSTFTVPTGVTSISVKVWGAGGGGGAGSGSTAVGGNGGGGGYAKADLTVTPSTNLTVEVGTAGIKAGANSRGGNGGGYSAVKNGGTFLVQAGGGGGGGGARGTTNGGNSNGSAGGSTTNGSTPTSGGGGGGFGSTVGGTGGIAGGTGAAGSNGAANAGGNAPAPATSCATTNPGSGGVVGSFGGPGLGGIFTTTCASGGGGGGGTFGGGGGGSIGTTNRGAGGGGGGSSLVTGANTVMTPGSGQTPGSNADTDRNNAGNGGTGATAFGTATSGTDGAVVITYTTSVPATTTASVYWAHFNTTNNSIESPNPGNGVCVGWCTNAVYNLPAALKGLSLIAYNGYLYAIGGSDSSNVPQSSVYIAKLGANGEPQLWHPSGGTPVYWYSDTALSNARSYFGAVAYNNRMYLFGGLTTSSTVLSTNTVQYADVKPNGMLTTWTATGMAALSSARYGLSAQVYNDTVYVIGGNATFTGTPINTVQYARLNSNGTMNSWQTTNSFTTGRQTMGGSFTALWGAYIYIGGGCTAVNASGYCTTNASDVQLASINADGSLAPWGSILNLSNNQIGYTFIAWQNGLYKLGGCAQQNVTTGECSNTLFTVEYGVINQDGDASTVDNSVPAGTGTCNGASPVSCDLPAAGDGAQQGGQMSSSVVINNGFIYVIGGCTSVATNNVCETGGTAASSGNVLYAALNSDGQIAKPATCGGTQVTNSTWCVDSTHTINGTAGISAASATVFNNMIYVTGGTNGAAWSSNVYRVGLSQDGSLAGNWTAQTFANLALGTSRGYTYSFTRANPANAATYPGNLYVLGGCYIAGGGTGDDGIGCSTYFTEVYKCNILTTGALEEVDANDCDTAGQMQLDADGISANGSQGLGLMAGTIYANRIYLVGGSCTQVGNPDDPCGSNFAANRRDTIYAKIDNSNNIVDNSTGLSTGAWTFTSGQMNPVRRRAVSFGYNGYIYSLAGYSGTASLQDLLFAKIDVSTGDMGSFSSSGVVVTPRWDLRAIVSNGYVYAIGGCATGAAPSGCTAMQPQVQTFQLYNNDSGSPAGFTASPNQFTMDRMGTSTAVLNGYIYVAGGCTVMSAGVCTTAQSRVDYAPLDAYGNVGAWGSLTDASMPDVRAFGKFVAVGGTLYFIGGQDSAGTVRASVFWATPSTSTGDITAWNTATQILPGSRTDPAVAVWNNRIYVLGGKSNAGTYFANIYTSPDLSAGGDITTAWTSTGMTSFNVVRSGATAIAYANNLYIMGGYNGTNYLNDVQIAQISSTGTVGAWTYSTSLPEPIRQGDGFAVNGYMYLIGGRSSDTVCSPNALVAPISANTTIVSGNTPTGVGDWYETNQKYTGDRYGAGVTYYNGKAYVVGGGCGASGTLTGANKVVQTSFYSQPQIAKYSIMFDTDSDVFPYIWLLNGIDNSVGSRWRLKYRSMTDPLVTTPSLMCASSVMSTWGAETSFGDVTLGTPGVYTPKDGSGTAVNCARYYYLSITIDSSQAFGYPEDVTRGPTITDLTLGFTANPSKRLMHGRTFVGGLQQPDDTPCRSGSGYAACSLP